MLYPFWNRKKEINTTPIIKSDESISLREEPQFLYHRLKMLYKLGEKCGLSSMALLLRVQVQYKVADILDMSVADFHAFYKQLRDEQTNIDEMRAKRYEQSATGRGY